MITGKEVVLSGQVRGIFFLLAFLWLLSCLCPDVLLHSQVALALFVIGKVGAWFTSLGLLYTGAPASFWGVPLCAGLKHGALLHLRRLADLCRRYAVWLLVAARIGSSAQFLCEASMASGSSSSESVTSVHCGQP